MNPDVELIRAWRKSPRAFIKDVWKLVPERDNQKFIKGKHISWQQDDILLAVEKALRGEATRRISVRSGHGIGKMHAYTMAIDTPKGRQCWGSLRPGDYVFGSDGKPTKILTTTHFKDVPMFRVTFDDRSYCDVSSGHLWTVRGRQERRKALKSWRTVETIDLFSQVKRKNGIALARQWEIPMQEPVQFRYRQISIHPYTVGVWLGDGGRESGRITSNDIEVIEHLRSIGETVTKGAFSSWSIVNLGVRLKALGIRHLYSFEKFVPEVYKYNSIEVRSEVLRGLLDTDGETGKEGSVCYSTTSQKLAEDVVWLARSLGGKARIQPTIKHPFYRTPNGEKKAGLPCFRVTITMANGWKCFYISRKQNRIKKVQKRYLSRWIDSIEPIPNADGMCVTVAAQNGLYLANDFIVTHNSTVLSWLILWFLTCFKDAQIPCTAPSSEQMHDVLWKELAKWISLMPEGLREKFEWQSGYIRVVESPETWFARAKTARKEAPEALAGVHGDHVMFVVDEASGVPDQIFNTAEGALTSGNVFFLMISNPTRLIGYFYDSHHSDKASWQTMNFSSKDSPIVDRKFTDRITEKHGEGSDEYSIRVLGEFPRADSLDEMGYVPLLTQADIRETLDATFGKDRVLGLDPSGEGSNKSVWVVRDRFKAKVVAIEEKSTPLTIAQKTLTLMDFYQVKPENVIVDAFGEGVKTIQELAKAHKFVQGILVGDSSSDDEFMNIRAEAYWKLREWIIAGGELVTHKDWKQLSLIRYRRELSDKLKIMGKLEMKREGIESPDVADALMLTFAGTIWTEADERETEGQNALYNKYDLI